MDGGEIKKEELVLHPYLTNSELDSILDLSFLTLSVAYVSKSRFISLYEVEDFVKFSKKGNERFNKVVDDLFLPLEVLYRAIQEVSTEVDDFTLLLQYQLFSRVFLTRPLFVSSRWRANKEGEEIRQLFQFYDQYINRLSHRRCRFKVEELYRIRYLGTIDHHTVQLTALVFFKKLIQLAALHPIRADSNHVMTVLFRNVKIIFRLFLVELFIRNQRFVKFFIVFYFVLKPQLPNGLPPSFK